MIQRHSPAAYVKMFSMKTLVLHNILNSGILYLRKLNKVFDGLIYCFILKIFHT